MPLTREQCPVVAFDLLIRVTRPPVPEPQIAIAVSRDDVFARRSKADLQDIPECMGEKVCLVFGCADVTVEESCLCSVLALWYSKCCDVVM